MQILAALAAPPRRTVTKQHFTDRSIFSRSWAETRWNAGIGSKLIDPAWFTTRKLARYLWHAKQHRKRVSLADYEFARVAQDSAFTSSSSYRTFFESIKSTRSEKRELPTSMNLPTAWIPENLTAQRHKWNLRCLLTSRISMNNTRR